MRDDIPLPRAGVLRLVDQHVIDAAVELVMHPTRRDAVQHGKRLVDQIVIVEQAALLLLAAIIRRRSGGDMQQRLGTVADRHGASSLDQGTEAENLGFEQPSERRIVLAEFLRHHRIARRAVVSEEYVKIFFDLRRSCKNQRSPKPSGLLLVGLAACFEGERDFLPPRSRQIRPVHDLALDIFDGVTGIDAERGADLGGCAFSAGAVGPGHEMIAAQTRLAHHILEGDVGGTGHRDLEHTPRCAVGIAGGVEQHCEIGALHHLVLVALVEHRKTRRDIGFERELLQQPGAKRVDGLHLQATRRFQGACEQLAGRDP